MVRCKITTEKNDDQNSFLNRRKTRSKQMWTNKTHTQRTLALSVEKDKADSQIKKIYDYYDELHPNDPKESVDCEQYPPYPRQRITRSNPYGIPETGLKHIRIQKQKQFQQKRKTKTNKKK
jgi:hypothetical protein